MESSLQFGMHLHAWRRNPSSITRPLQYPVQSEAGAIACGTQPSLPDPCSLHAPCRLPGRKATWVPAGTGGTLYGGLPVPNGHLRDKTFHTTGSRSIRDQVGGLWPHGPSSSQALAAAGAMGPLSECAHRERFGSCVRLRRHLVRALCRQWAGLCT